VAVEVVVARERAGGEEEEAMAVVEGEVAVAVEVVVAREGAEGEEEKAMAVVEGEAAAVAETAAVDLHTYQQR
jgi:hypothetical protein